MPQVGDFRKPELTLRELGIQTVLAEFGKNETKVFSMLLLRFGVDKDIIKVHYDKFVEVLHENIVHQARESGWSVC